MAYKGKVIVNPVNRQSIEFVTTAKESNGEQLEMIATWEPHSIKPIEHYHPYQHENFGVLAGELTLIINGKTSVLRQGQSVDIPAKAAHAMWNNSNKKTVVKWKITPAMHTEYFLETGMGLAADNRTGRNGVPGILQTSLLARKYKKEFRLRKPPYFIQQIVFTLLVPFALLSGKKAVYKKYLD
ncbi:MAG TPA: cupin domain-containing protein [Flavisolibacter sp.]|nr:cupin domain-containing protein [Flavisolibacter sp.]